MLTQGRRHLRFVTKLLLIPLLNIYHSTISLPRHPHLRRHHRHLTPEAVIYDAARPRPHQSDNAFITGTFHRHRFCFFLRSGKRRERNDGGGVHSSQRHGETSLLCKMAAAHLLNFLPVSGVNALSSRQSHSCHMINELDLTIECFWQAVCRGQKLWVGGAVFLKQMKKNKEM